MKFPVFPEQGSAVAREVDALYFALVGLSGLVLVFVFLPMACFLFKYRRGGKANRARILVPTWKIEVAWSVIPLLLTFGIFGWAAELYFEMERPPADALEVNVVGKQWMWKIQH